MKYLLFFLLFCSLCACQNPGYDGGEKTELPKDSLIVSPLPNTVMVEGIDAADRTYVPGKRIGLITATTTPEDLTRIYGPDNVRKDSIPLGKGFFVNGYKLFPGTSSELSVIYPNEVTGSKDLQVTIDLGSTDWKSAQNGVAIGTTLEELERYNGQAFAFFGFDWDYGGVVTDWQSGALKDHRLRLGYDYENRGKLTLHKTVRGEQKVVSNSPYVSDLGIRVIQIIVRLPEQQAGK